MGSGLFGLFASPKKRRKKHNKSNRIGRNKRHKLKGQSKRSQKKTTGVFVSKANNDFKKIKRILKIYNPKTHISPHSLRKQEEKYLEDILFSVLNSSIGSGFKSQMKRRVGICDLAYNKVGIELKLCKKGGVRLIRDRLTRQVRDYSKSFKKLVIYILNYQKDSNQDNSFIKRYLEKEFNDIKSVKKRDIAIIIRKV